MDLKSTALLIAGAAVLGIVILRVFAAPLKLLMKVGANTLLGLGSLALLNATGHITGLSLGFNLFNALVVGILGVPGLGLLLLTRWTLGT